MPLIIVALGILALLFLIMGLKLNTFISLLVVSFGVALALGMPFDKVVSSIEAGIGGLLCTSRSSSDSVRCWAS